MLNIEFYKKSWFFKELTLSEWEFLFKEWEIDENLYIIESWEIFILRNINFNNDYKVLSVLYDLDIFWEWFLNEEKPKTVSVKANKQTKLLKINKKNLDLFWKKYHDEINDLYKHIIIFLNDKLLELDKHTSKMDLKLDNSINSKLLDLENNTKKRVVDLDNYIVSVYEIDKFISEISIYNNSSLFKLITKFNQIINSEFILYIEKNLVVENYFTLKYDTRFPWKMLDDTLEIKEENDIYKVLFLKKENYYIQKINVLNNYVWFFVIWKKIEFSYNEKKIISTISALLASVINQKMTIEQKDKDENYIENKESY